MVRFAGYAKKREPKWPYVLMALSALLVVIVVIFIASAVTSWLESEINKPVVTTTTTTTVSSTTTTTSAAAVTSTTVTSSTTSTTPGKAGGSSVSKIVVTSGLDDSNLPVDDLQEVSVNEYDTIYCYTPVRCDSPPQTIKHVWLAPGGAEAAEIELTLNNRSGATWSYINIAGMPVGEWVVEVRAADGTVLARRSFKTY